MDLILEIRSRDRCWNSTIFQRRKSPAHLLDDLPLKRIGADGVRLMLWNAIQSSLGNSDKFIHKFRKATKKGKLGAILVEAQQVQDDLVDRGWIRPVNANYLKDWKGRISELRSDTHRLRRLYAGYDAHDLPYRFEQRKEIRELFRSFEEQIAFSKKGNVARRKFLLAKEHGDSGRIWLTTEERGVPPKLIIFNGFLVGAGAQHCQGQIRQRDRFATTMTIPTRNGDFGVTRAGSEWPARRAHSTACPNA